MALSIIRRIYARIKLWFDERDEEMERWHKEDPGGYYTFMEEQQRNFRGGI